jgi:hypothetical protein
MMEKEVDELVARLKMASSFELPSYKELPAVPLYMEQVTAYINDTLKDANPLDKDLLTSFMVNNYVKAGIIPSPKKKKYEQDHLGYLLAITTLKRTLSISEIALLIDMDEDVSSDKSILYGFFKIMTKDILQENAKTVVSKIESLQKRHTNEKNAGNPLADEHLRDSLGLIAFRLAIKAGVFQLFSQSILDSIGKGTHGEKVFEMENTPGHKEKEGEAKITAAQSRRVAQYKRSQKKSDENSEKEKK